MQKVNASSLTEIASRLDVTSAVPVERNHRPFGMKFRGAPVGRIVEDADRGLPPPRWGGPEIQIDIEEMEPADVTSVSALADYVAGHMVKAD